jgi:hypothetical protein
MPTRFRTTPDPPIIDTPAARDHAMRTRYTGTLTMMGMPMALRSAAMTSGNSVYPMIETDWKKALARVSKAPRMHDVNVHVASQQLDLHRHNCLSYPDQRENAREDEILLLAPGAPREEQTEQQAEY